MHGVGKVKHHWGWVVLENSPICWYRWIFADCVIFQPNLAVTESIFCTNPMNFSRVPLIYSEEEFKDFKGNKTWLCYLNFENEK